MERGTEARVQYGLFSANSCSYKNRKITRENNLSTGSLIFNAFNTTALQKVKVVILGQDPYHGRGQAHGLCFSVQNGVPPPPSLLNIFKELQNDIGITIPDHGNLTKWAEQGVFLLNASLTVRAGEPMSHSKIGWSTFTDAVIKTISSKKKILSFYYGESLRKKKEF